MFNCSIPQIIQQRIHTGRSIRRLLHLVLPLIIQLTIPGTTTAAGCDKTNGGSGTEFKPHSIICHHHPEHQDNHVHFDDHDVNDDLDEDNSIRYKLTDPQQNIVTVHLGFLQIRHKYKLALRLPLDRCAATQKLAAENSSTSSTPVAIKLEQVESADGGWCKLTEYNPELDTKASGEPVLELVVEFSAHKEKFLKEQLRLRLNDTDQLQLIFTARVLGKGKGTPMLRNGIQSVSVEEDEEDGTSSDATSGH